MRGAPWTTAVDGSPIPRIVSSIEAAQLLGISDSAVRGLCRRGHVFPGALRFGGAWWIPIGELNRRHYHTRGRQLTALEVRGVVGDAPGR